MKKSILLILFFLLLSGCHRKPDEIQIAMELRSKLLQSDQCHFAANILADYGDKIHEFSMDCIADSNGNMTFTVLRPDSISGITGQLSKDGGKLTFDDVALHFGLMADEQISPISAPWILITTLQGGNIISACTEDGMIRLSIDDSYEEETMRLDIWLDEEKKPACADILYAGRRILSIDVANFEIL